MVEVLIVPILNKPRLLFVDKVLRNVSVVTNGPIEVEKLEMVEYISRTYTVDKTANVDITSGSCITGPSTVEKLEKVLNISGKTTTGPCALENVDSELYKSGNCTVGPRLVEKLEKVVYI